MPMFRQPARNTSLESHQLSQVFEKSVTPNEISPSQEHPHPDDQTTRFNSRLSALKLNGGKCILAAFYVQDG